MQNLVAMCHTMWAYVYEVREKTWGAGTRSLGIGVMHGPAETRPSLLRVIIPNLVGLDQTAYGRR